MVRVGQAQGKEIGDLERPSLLDEPRHFSRQRGHRRGAGIGGQVHGADLRGFKARDRADKAAQRPTAIIGIDSTIPMVSQPPKRYPIWASGSR
jgi:hypothetical protein